MKRKSRQTSSLLPDIPDFTGVKLDFELTEPINEPKFVARFEPPPSSERCARFIYGQGWSEAEHYIEADPIVAYQYGKTPHLDFANLVPGQRVLDNGKVCAGENEALQFLSRWGPLKKTHYLPVKEQVIEDTYELLEPLRFRTPLVEFWQEQKKFQGLVAIWNELSQGGDADGSALINALNPVLRRIYPVLDWDEDRGEMLVARLGGQKDLFTSLYYCLWSDIARRSQVRRCKNEFCQQFFRPSREAQLYHSEICKRRQLQREYAREKRKAIKRRGIKRRR